MTATCPSPEELSRALSQGGDVSMEEHIASCTECRAEWNGMQRIRTRAKELASPPVARAVARRVRARLVQAAEADRRRTVRNRKVAWSGFAIAAAATLALGLHRRHEGDSATAPKYHGTVTALSGARFTRESARPNEVVRLEAGTIHIEVTPLDQGERFVVRAEGSEVEVRGTAFDVVVVDGHLASVHVDHGRVEVRDSGASPVTLGAGAVWDSAPLVQVSPTSQGSPIASSAIPGVPPTAPRTGIRATSPKSSSTTADSSALRSLYPLTTPIATTDTAPPPLPTAAHQDSLPGPVQPAPRFAVPSALPTTKPPAEGNNSDERRDRREERHERMDERRMR